MDDLTKVSTKFLKIERDQLNSELKDLSYEDGKLKDVEEIERLWLTNQVKNRVERIQRIDNELKRRAPNPNEKKRLESYYILKTKESLFR